MCVTETGLGSIWREMRAMLRLKGIRDVSECSLVAYRRLSLDHEIETVEGVAPGSRGATQVLREVPGFALGGTGAEGHGAVQPDSEQRRDAGASVRARRRQPVQLGILRVSARLSPSG